MEKPTEPGRPVLTGDCINWNQVFYFCQIALHGSVKNAASHLGLSASTLSEHLTQLETDLDVDLFQRSHRKLTLTAQGSRLFQHAKQMFEAGQRLIDALSPVALGRYPISIGLVSAPSTRLAYQLISEFLRHNGSMSLKVAQTKHEELERGLLEAKFDFGFSDRGAERKDIVAGLIFSSLIRFYVAPKWEGKSIEELFRMLPVLHSSSDSHTRGLIDHLLGDLELTPKDVITSDYPGLLYELCEAGQAIGVFSEKSASRLGSKLWAIPLPPRTLEIQDKLFVLWTKDAENSDAIKRLKELLASGDYSGEVKFDDDAHTRR